MLAKSLEQGITLLRSTATEISEDRIFAVAGGITFFTLLAMFPGLGILVSLYGIFGDRTSIAHVVDAALPFLPSGAITVLDGALRRLVAEKTAPMNFSFCMTLLVALWSASGGVSALIDGLNVACETKETRSFWRLTANAILFTVAGILFAAALCYLVVLVPVAAHHFRVRREIVLISPLLEWPLSFLICLILTGMIYRVGPDVGKTRRLWVSWGSVTASGLWLAITAGFDWYVDNFGSYDRVYGSLGAIVGFLTWMWLLLVILLSGAELNCEIDRRRRSGD